MKPLLRLGTVLLVLGWSTVAMAADYRCRAGAHPPGYHEGDRLRVATLNIAHGRGSALNQMLIGRRGIERNLDAAAGLISRTGAVLVGLQELDVNSLWAGGFDHAARLLSKSRHDCIVVGLHARTWLYQFGTGLLSSVKLIDPRVRSFKPTPPTTTKGLVSATLQWRRGDRVRPVRVVSVHLDFSRKGARKHQVSAVVDAVRASTVPVIVLGDFNEGWGEGSVVRRLVEEGGLTAHQPGAGGFATYRSSRLDWILVSGELEFLEYRVLDDAVSDHRLVVAELGWRSAS